MNDKLLEEIRKEFEAKNKDFEVLSFKLNQDEEYVLLYVKAKKMKKLIFPDFSVLSIDFNKREIRGYINMNSFESYRKSIIGE